jgi:hypothetical protein
MNAPDSTPGSACRRMRVALAAWAWACASASVWAQPALPEPAAAWPKQARTSPQKKATPAAPDASTLNLYWQEQLPLAMDREGVKRIGELSSSFRLKFDALNGQPATGKARLLQVYTVRVQHEILLSMARARVLDPELLKELPVLPGSAENGLDGAAAQKYRDWYQSMLAPVSWATRPTAGDAWAADILRLRRRALEIAEILKMKDLPAVVNPGYPSTPSVQDELIAKLGAGLGGGPKLGIDQYWLSRRPKAFSPQGFLEVAAVHVKALPGGLARNCTGTLVDRKTLLTAAHCVSAAVAKDVLVWVQTNDAAQMAKCEAALRRREYIRCNGFREMKLATDGISIHERYLQGQLRYDVAVLVLAEELPDAVIAQLSFEPIVAKVTLAGFGRTNLPESTEGVLAQDLLMRIEVGWHEGNLINGPVSMGWSVPRLSAGGTPTLEKLSSGACRGDSGGPVYSGTQTGFASDAPMPHRVVAIIREGSENACKDYVSTQTLLSDPTVSAWLCAKLSGLPNIPCADTKKLASAN